MAMSPLAPATLPFSSDAAPPLSRHLSGLVALSSLLLGLAASAQVDASPLDEVSVSAAVEEEASPAAGTAKKPVANVPEYEPPALAPFTAPAPGRPLSPPSQLAGLGDSPFAEDGAADSIESTLVQLQSEALVETAGKRPQKLNEVPMTVSWIPAEELAGTGQFTLCDAIQYFPGMECRRGPMRKVAISARGLGSNFLSNRLLLLQDGRPQTDPWTGQFYGDETTPLTNIKQIEVIRGPGSSLYGSNAMSGVINIIRRTPQDLIKNERNYGFDAKMMAGQNSTVRVETTGAGKAGDLSGLVSYYGFRSDGPELFSNESLGLRDRNQWSVTNQVSGTAMYKSLRMDADFTDASLGRPGGTQISTVGNCGRCHYTPNDREDVQSFNANAQFDHKVNDNVRVFAQAYTLFKRRTVDLEDLITTQMQTVLGKRNRVGGEARTLLTLGDATVTVGGDVKRDQVNNQNIFEELSIDDTHQTIFGAFVDGEYRLLENLVVSAGLRYDNYQIPQNVWRNATDQVSPRASIVFHALPELTLRTNYGRAFRAPTLAELAINQQMYASTLLGNPNLKPETLDAFEAAVDVWPFGGRARFTLTGFYNVARDFISQDFSIGSTSRFMNLGNARVLGAEIEAATQLKEINASFDVALQVLDAKSIDYEGNASALEYAPSYRVYFRARKNLTDVAFAELYGLYVGERLDPGIAVDERTGEQLGQVHLDPYVSANARVGLNVAKGLSMSLIGSNLFNSSFQETLGFPAAPLNVFAELRYEH